MSRGLWSTLLVSLSTFFSPGLRASPPAGAPVSFKLGVDFRVTLKQPARSEDRRLSLVLLDTVIERNDEGSEDYAEVTLDLRAGGKAGRVKVPFCLKCGPVRWGSYVLRVRNVDNRPPGAAVLHITAARKGK